MEIADKEKQRILKFFTRKQNGLKGPKRRKDYNKTKIFESEIEESGDFSLEEFIRASAQGMLGAAIENEATEYLKRLWGERSSEAEGFRGYRNGYLPERKLSTSVGMLYVRQPRISDIPEKDRRSLDQSWSSGISGGVRD